MHRVHCELNINFALLSVHDGNVVWVEITSLAQEARIFLAMMRGGDAREITD